MRTKEISFSELAYRVFPEELTAFYEKNISFYALLRKIRKVNESLAFDIWRYMLRRVEAKRKRFEHSLVNAYEFRFDDALEGMYLSALCYDERLREVLFLKVSEINERHAWLLYLALKHDKADVFDECMRMFRRNIHRFGRSRYSLDTLLLRVIDRLHGRVDEAYMNHERYNRIVWFADMIALPRKRRVVYDAARRALEFYCHQNLNVEERKQAVHEKVMRTARQTKDRRIRERDVKYPLWEEGHTVVPYRIAGLHYYLSSEEILGRLPVGTLLKLSYDWENKHDYIAVAVSLTDGTKVGYIGKPYNRAFCELLCKGEKLFALVSEVDTDVTGAVTVWITVVKE